MKLYIKRLILPVIALIALAGCADWLKPEAVKIGHTDLTVTDKDNAYYQALREYKASDHEISFGWYSRWDEPALTTDGMLSGIPDSMDVVSLWSNSRNLSPERLKDLRFVQQVKGTKVVMCTFCQYVGRNYTPEEYDGTDDAREKFWGWVDGDEEAIASAIAKYAKAINDTIVAYGYDGLDIDYEPNIDGVKGKLDENPAYFSILCNELSKYIGPKSGTGRLFIIDGEVFNLPAELCTCFDYIVAQAYAVSGGTPSPTATGSESDMDYRLSQVVTRFAPYMTEEEVTNRFVVTENLESAMDALNGGFYWRTNDGVTQDKKKIPSMLGMAMWQPSNGFRKGGFGGYRFDNEANNDPAYKWMRKGIQAQNPAGGVKRILARFSDNKDGYSFEYKKDYFGNFPVENVGIEFSLLFAGIAPQDVVFDVTYEQSLIPSSRKAIDADRVIISGDGALNVAAGSVRTGSVSVTVDLKDLEIGEYTVPIKVNFPEGSPYYSDGDLVRNITISWKDFEPILVYADGSDNISSVKMEDDGTLSVDTIEDSFAVRLVENAPEALSFALSYDPALVSAYNAERGTDFVAVDASKVTLPSSVSVTAGSNSSSVATSIDLSGLESGKYLVPVRVALPDGMPLTSDGEIIRWFKFMIGKNNVIIDSSEMTGAKIQPTDGWRVRCYSGINTSGWTGVWNNDSDAQQKAMFDGMTYSDASPYYWYTISSYFNPGSVIYEMDREYQVSGLRWHVAYGSTYDQFTISDVQISNDRENWYTISYGTTHPADIGSDLWINIPFKTPVTAKYIRLIVATSYYASMDEAEVWAPAE